MDLVNRRHIYVTSVSVLLGLYYRDAAIARPTLALSHDSIFLPDFLHWPIHYVTVWYKTKFGSQNFGYQI